ncbi:MAG: hypothetical protein BRC26_03450, partial [Nanohaloarchaea archaeon QH_8_44_6]
DQELVELLDQKADRDECNRSQTVENMLESYFRKQGLGTAVILCGDPELRSLELYKGKPVIAHVLEHISDHDIANAILLAGQNAQKLREQFGSIYEDVNIEYVSEESPRGTASALQDVEKRLNTTFVLMNGHVLTDVDIDEMLQVHRDQETTATMALTTVQNPSKYGVARLKGQKILGFEEKPETGEEPSRLINAGTYILDPDIFSRLDHDDLEKVFETL